MTTFTTGQDALAALNATNEGGGSSAEFAPFKSGTSYRVRIMTPNDLIAYYGYSIFKVVNTFVAQKPSKLNAKGFPEKDLTLWDKAAQYYSDLAFKAQSEDEKQELRKQAGLYRGSTRFVFGFIDLDTGLPIYIDLSKKQALAVHSVITKNAAKLGKKAFELEKTGQSTSTQVMLSPLDLDDLNAKQAANFEKVEGFASFSFDGLLYESDEAQQAEDLRKAGFDLSLIGYGDGVEAPAAEQESKEPFPF